MLRQRLVDALQQKHRRRLGRIVTAASLYPVTDDVAMN